MQEDDAVFRALADRSRRLLLDRLRDQDGQTLGDLCAALPALTRFGVMKHLDVLERAGLVITQRHGRHKHHYLNPVPLRVVLDRWLSPFTAPLVEALARVSLDAGAPPATPEVPPCPAPATSSAPSSPRRPSGCGRPSPTRP